MHNKAISLYGLNPGGSFRRSCKEKWVSAAQFLHSHTHGCKHTNGIPAASKPNGSRVHWPLHVFHYRELICLHIKTLLKDWGQSQVRGQNTIDFGCQWKKWQSPHRQLQDSVKRSKVGPFRDGHEQITWRKARKTGRRLVNIGHLYQLFMHIFITTHLSMFRLFRHERPGRLISWWMQGEKNAANVIMW